MDLYECRFPPRHLLGAVVLPGSKSLTNRALICAAMANGESVLANVPLAEDVRLMIEALQALGVRLTVDRDACVVEVTGCGGRLPAMEADLFCGNAGTVMRFCAALVATQFGRYRLDGHERMRRRPIGELGRLLQELGAGVEYLGEEGFPPLIVHANGLRGGSVSLAGPPSSQFVSALLLAAPGAGGDVMIEIRAPVPSVPYLRMTEKVMEDFGVPVLDHHDACGIKFIVAAPQRYVGRSLRIEPDASSATYFLAAPAIAGGWITVEGLGGQSSQGDVRFVDVLERMGCRVERETSRLTVHGPSAEQRLRGVDVDLNDMPDAVPTLTAIALFADGPTVIRNVAHLRVKESDRLHALHVELSKLGAVVEERPDGLTIHPLAHPRPAALGTHDDHRLAMSFALIGLRLPGLVIQDPQCCRKSFPDFFTRFEQIALSTSAPGV